MLRIHELSHRFGGRGVGRVVLDKLSFEVQPGEIVALLGPNGCGKSTTFRVMTGMLVPDSGELYLHGTRIAPGARALRRQLGVVFQAPSLDARLTVIENLLLSAAIYGVRGAEATRRADELLALSDLSERRIDRVLELSGGMKRRIELCRALLHDPALLVMDEPTTGLDETAFRKTWSRIELLRRERGLTVLLSTHRADEAERCDRVIVIDEGRVIAQGTPKELQRQVSGDVISLQARDPEALCDEIRAQLKLEARVISGRVVLEHERGHELIPRLVEALPKGRIETLSMHKPTLADVFVKLTGRSLGDTHTASAQEVAKKKAS